MIQRIDGYDDPRFSSQALAQHGCFLVDGVPVEIVIVSEREAVIQGAKPDNIMELINEFRFYAPQITTFLDENGEIIKEFPPVQIFTLSSDSIQPSQFYVDEEKITAIRSFIHGPEDIVIQVMPYEGRYISLDGHTRLFYAVMNGWNKIRAVEDMAGDYIFGFVEEAKQRGILNPKHLQLVDHGTYQEKWDKFCDAFFKSMENG